MCLWYVSSSFLSRNRTKVIQPAGCKKKRTGQKKIHKTRKNTKEGAGVEGRASFFCSSYKTKHMLCSHPHFLVTRFHRPTVTNPNDRTWITLHAVHRRECAFLFFFLFFSLSRSLSLTLSHSPSLVSKKRGFPSGLL